MGRRARKKKARRSLEARLTDDLVVEILSRLPVRSLCRCKCVSRHWRGLISHPDHRRRLPQTLGGVFYSTDDDTRFPEEARHFADAWGIGHGPRIRPSFSFFPGYERIIRILDSCNGLLLCRLSTQSSSSSDQNASFSYLVCNPATERWVVLPDSGCGTEARVARLGFDPALSSHFHVFEFIDNDRNCVAGVQIYSCETQSWSYKESEWGHDNDISLDYDDTTSSVFLNGLLHLMVFMGVVTVDVDGESWQVFSVPDYGIDGWDYQAHGWEPGYLGQYQGQLCYINDHGEDCDLSIWVTKDSPTDEWVLEHLLDVHDVCKKVMSLRDGNFHHVITVHPDCNLILYVAGRENMLMAYDFDRQEAWAVKHLGSKCRLPYIPYTPFYGSCCLMSS